MPQSLTKVYTHIVFATKHRIPMIDDHLEDPLFKYIGGICNSLECYPIQVGGYRDHVHILCRLSPKIAQMRLVREIKRSSSVWVKTQGIKYRNFYWQGGYSIFSVNPTRVSKVTEYIKNQRQHHQHRDYKTEVLAFLNQYNVEYDPKYLWD